MNNDMTNLARLRKEAEDFIKNSKKLSDKESVEFLNDLLVEVFSRGVIAEGRRTQMRESKGK